MILIQTYRTAQFIACLMFGMVAAFGMAPAHNIPSLIIGYSVFLCVFNIIKTVQPLSRLKAFTLSACFGFGYFLVNLNWIGNALLVEGNDYAWAYPLAVAGLPFALSFFYGFAGLVLRRIDVQSFTGYLSAVLTFAVFDWLRGHVLTGFPWNLPVHALGEALPALQLLAWVDLYALNLIVLLFACSGAFILCRENSRKAKISFCITLIVIAGGILAYGQSRLIANPLILRDGITLKVVQPNVPQNEKWSSDHTQSNFERMLELSAWTDGDDDHTLIVWPETAINSFMISPDRRRQIQKTLNEYSSARLLTGILTHDPNQGYGNATALIDQNDEFSNITNKTKLVPFGEFVPFQNILPLKTITQFQGFERGTGEYSSPLSYNHNIFNLTYASLVCYEVLFPNLHLKGHVKGLGENLDMIVNVTNDAWYGDSAGPRQHLWHARFRAIEHGVPVIRSANTGISAVFDSYGRIVVRSNLGDSSMLKTQLPVRGTVLSENKALTFWCFILSLVFLIFLQKWRARKDAIKPET
jgi:apolipoprotein N-acyltransferase